MEYDQLLEILYNDDINEILEVLNSSVYAEDFPMEIDKYTVCHTGFSFETHKGRTMELLFDTDTKTIIRQIRRNSREVPPIVGMVYTKNSNKHFDDCCRLVMTAILRGDNFFVVKTLNNFSDYLHLKEVKEIVVINMDEKEETHKALIIYKEELGKEELEIVKEIPLQKTLKSSIYFGNGRFKLDSYFNKGEGYNTNRAFYDATDGQLGDLGDDGWAYLGRD